MSKKIPKNLQPFNNSGANKDDKEEGNGDGDVDDNTGTGTYTLRTRTRRRRSSRRATTTTAADDLNCDDAVTSSDKGATTLCRRTSTAY